MLWDTEGALRAHCETDRRSISTTGHLEFCTCTTGFRVNSKIRKATDATDSGRSCKDNRFEIVSHNGFFLQQFYYLSSRPFKDFHGQMLTGWRSHSGMIQQMDVFAVFISHWRKTQEQAGWQVPEVVTWKASVAAMDGAQPVNRARRRLYFTKACVTSRTSCLSALERAAHWTGCPSFESARMTQLLTWSNSCFFFSVCGFCTFYTAGCTSWPPRVWCIGWRNIVWTVIHFQPWNGMEELPNGWLNC